MIVVEYLYSKPGGWKRNSRYEGMHECYNYLFISYFCSYCYVFMCRCTEVKLLNSLTSTDLT